MDSDLVKLSEHANNEKVTVNLRDAFPKPYTLKDAENFKKIIDSQNSKTFFAIDYKGEYVGNISLSVGNDVYKKVRRLDTLSENHFGIEGLQQKQSV